MRELLLFLTAVVLHEGGHLLCAALLNVPFSRLTLCPCGAVMTFDFSRTTYFRELCVHLAGGVTGTAAALIVWKISGNARFLGITLCLTFMNLLPVEGFDGGGVLHCILSMLLPPATADAVCHAVSVAAVLLLWTIVLWVELKVRATVTVLLFVVYILLFYTKIIKF